MRALTALAAAALCGFALVGSCGTASAAGFKRGASLVEFFNFPQVDDTGIDKSYADPPFPHAESALAQFNFADLRRLGFDHMRVPIDLGPLMYGSEALRREVIGQLVAVVSKLQRYDLAVLVTAYPPSLHHELPETYLDGLDGPKFRLYFSMVDRVAEALGAMRTGLVAFEPMNEAQSKCHVTFGTDWTAYQDYMVAQIRRVAPELPLFLTGGCASDIKGIVLLDSDSIHDRRNFISVHFYNPFEFTHQSASWTMPYLANTVGVPYPASAGALSETLALTRERIRTAALGADLDRRGVQQKAEAEIRKYFQDVEDASQIDASMQLLADWQTRQGIAPDRVVFTEFGALKQTIDGVEIDRASRSRWLHDVSSAIESHGFGWTVYVLHDDPMGLYRYPTDRYPDPDLLRALRLNVPQQDDLVR